MKPCKHGNESGSRFRKRICNECELEDHIETLRSALKAATARLSRVDGGDSVVVSNALDAFAATGEEFDVDAFIAEEEEDATEEEE